MAHEPLDSSCSRRTALWRLGQGFGALALAGLLKQEQLLGDERENALAVKEPHHKPRAKSVIWLMMEGGPSGFDLFDPKPELERNHGKKCEGISPFFGSPGPLMRSPYQFRKYGQSGISVCDRLPYIADCVDDLALIKSIHAESNSHAPAMYQMNTGFVRPGFPSTGSWSTYGLGSVNQDLPGFVVLPKQSGIKGGALNWGAGFLPGAYQGTIFRGGENPILNLKRAKDMTDAQQRSQLDLSAALNTEHASLNPAERDLEARIASFELAYRMQFEASDAVDLSRETPETKTMYGLDAKETRDYGTKLLLARRLVERGVRFIQCYPDDQWDAHNDLKDNHDSLCKMTDQPVAALLKDLKRRGLLESTLVIWGGEFGRLPISQSGKGRDHNPYGFMMWMAGGGIKGGFQFGATDELGYKAVENPVSIPDIHATILHALGLDHKRLTYTHNGRRFRLTDVSGNVIQQLFC